MFISTPSSAVTINTVNIKHLNPLSTQHRLTTLALVVSQELLQEELQGNAD